MASNWPEMAEMLNNQDRPVQIGSYPGIFGTLRDLMEWKVVFWHSDEPELVKDIMDYLTDYWIYLFEVCKDVKVDILHIWEYVGQAGSLISPAHIRDSCCQITENSGPVRQARHSCFYGECRWQLRGTYTYLCRGRR